MLILAVETATSSQGVAILEDDKVLAHSPILPQNNPPSRNLLPTIHELLKSINLTVREVEVLAASIGPGSFTGLRVGIATLLGLRMKLGLPLVGVSTLEAIAQQCQDSSHPMCPILKAGRGEIYWAQFQYQNSTVVRESEDRVGSVVECIESILKPTVILGEGWSEHKNQFEKALGRHCLSETSPEIITLAVQVGLLALRQFEQCPSPSHRLVPKYVHPSYAEQRKGKSKANLHIQ